MLKILAVGAAASAAMGVAATALSSESLSAFADLGSTVLLGWYLYYDVAIARPAREKARVEAEQQREDLRAASDQQRDTASRELVEEFRKDTAVQLTRQADHYERTIDEIKKTFASAGRQSDRGGDA